MASIDDIISTKPFADKMATQNYLFRKNILLQFTEPYIPKGRAVCTQGIAALGQTFKQNLLFELIAFGVADESQRFEVQHHTLCDGWTNTWTTTDDEGTEQPDTYASREEAQAAIDEFLADIASEIECGERATDEGYVAEEFRIEVISTQSNGFTEDCDPNGWHDFGVLQVDGETVWFKIDYYDLNYEYGAEDPSDLNNNRRVMTLMLPSEY